MAGTYDVVISALRAGQGWLSDDAISVAGGRDQASGAASTAAGAVNGGQLGAASYRLSMVISRVGNGLCVAIDDAASTLAGNADRYTADDAAASRSLDAVDFGEWRR